MGLDTILLAQDQAVGIAVLAVFGLVYLAVFVFIIASYWRILTKAGEEGWKVLVPVYNGWVYAQIAGRPGWWGLMLLIPFVNLVFGILLAIDIAHSFGKDSAFAVGLVLLAPIFFGILAFGDARYLGPAGPDGRPGWTNPAGQQQAGWGEPQGGYQPPPGQSWG